MTYRYPFTPYPNGWYRVATSAEVRSGTIVRKDAFGHAIIVFRSEDGATHVCEAHCPHLGADLSVGGEVVGDTVACPFHGWRFDGSGQCVEIPYCKRIPPKAKLRAWPTCERDGLVFAYHDAAQRAPAFDLPAGPFRDGVRWSKPLHFSWRIRVHIQEVAENALDVTHFPKVHAYAKTPHIKRFDTDGPRFVVHLDTQRHGMQFIGKTPMNISYHGLGVVHAHLDAKLGNRLPLEVGVVLTTTPIDQEHCEVNIMARHRLTWNPLWNQLVRPFMVREISADFENDIPIWESKRYLERPALCADDGPIGRVRAWARQFYDDYEAVGASARGDGSGATEAVGSPHVIGEARGTGRHRKVVAPEGLLRANRARQGEVA